MDAGIILQGRAPEFMTPYELAMGGNQTAISTAQTQDALRARKQQMTIRDMMAKNTVLGEDGRPIINRQNTVSQLFGTNPELATQAQGQFDAQDAQVQQANIERQKGLAGLTKDQLENYKAINDAFSRTLGGVKDQASWTNAKNWAIINGVPHAQELPDVYDQGFANQLNGMVLNAKDMLENEWKKNEYDLKTAEFGLDKQKFGYQVEKDNADREWDATKWQTERQDKINSAEAGTNSKQIEDSRAVLSLVDEASPLIDQATNSTAGNLIDKAAGAFGASTSGADAAAKLKVLQGSLVSKMPKMSGPQSDKDVLLYREMAGQIGDPTVPASQKKAALETIRQINTKYLQSQVLGGSKVVTKDDILATAKASGLSPDQVAQNLVNQGYKIK